MWNLGKRFSALITEKLIESKRSEHRLLTIWLNEHDREERHPELNRWDDNTPTAHQKYIKLHEIVVETQEDKEQILAASRYIHDLMELDTGYLAVNHIAHLYTDPDCIIVRPSAVDTPEAKL